MTVSVIEEEPTDLECSESLMTIKSYRDTQKKVIQSDLQIILIMDFYFRENRDHVQSSHFHQFNFCQIQTQMCVSFQPSVIKKNVQGT